MTETDQAVELMVSTALKEMYPTYAFLGEETYQPNTPLTDVPTFVCDPIDGTVNFVHGHPYVSISLALCIDSKPVVGVVYNPFINNLYTAISGRGAFLNLTTPLPLKKQPEPLPGLRNALCAVEWGSDRSGNNWAVKLDTFKNLGGEDGAMVHSMRSLGSAALNFCGVAAGTLDLYWEAGCWAWDVAAGWVILEEAGGLVADANPGHWQPRVDGRRYMAVRKLGEGGGGKTQKEIVEEFWGNVKGEFKYQL